MELSRRRHRGLLAFAFTASAGCSLLRPNAAADPDINFAAHTASRGIVVDRMDGDQHGTLGPSDSRAGGPQFVLQTAAATTAAFWVSGSRTAVRPSPDSTALALGQVEASWEDNAIRFTLAPAAGGFSTSPFKRIEGGASPAALGQPAASILDLRGVYRADVVDAAGKPAGWLRVRVDSRWGPAHIYDGALPQEIDGPLAVAVVAQLDAALNAVEDAAANPYIGN